MPKEKESPITNKHFFFVVSCKMLSQNGNLGSDGATISVTATISTAVSITVSTVPLLLYFEFLGFISNGATISATATISTTVSTAVSTVALLLYFEFLGFIPM